MKLLFEGVGAVAAGDYLIGHYRWETGVRLLQARFEGEVSRSEWLELGLELGGVITAKRVVVGVGSVSLRKVIGINLVAGTGQEVRWKVIRAPSAWQNGSAMAHFSVVIEAMEESFAGAVAARAEMVLRWRSGSEALDLWRYDAATHRWSEVTAGMSAGRARVVSDGQRFELWITSAGEEAKVFEVDALGITRMTDLAASGRAAVMLEPRVEWLIGGRRVAQVSRTGRFETTDLAEAAAVMGGGGFELYAGGALRAMVGKDGLKVVEIIEG